VRKLRVLGALLAALCIAPILRAEPAHALSERDKAQVQRIVRDYLLQNPGLLEEMMTALQAERDREAAAEAARNIAAHRDEVFAAHPGMVAGNPAGDVTLVEFFDYRCGYCRAAQPMIARLLKEDPNVRVVFKEYPVLGPASITASRAAVAAARQGKYVDFHMALMSLKEPLTDEVLYRVAGEVGLDVERLKQDMKSEEVDEVLEENLALAAKLNVDGTPNFIVGRHMMPGLVTYETLRTAIEDTRKKPPFEQAKN
jgi:protein-disulfide isomerase